MQDKITKQKAGNRLLAWYQKAKRDLPWRQTKDPYRIWISETMLQQTRVDTVKPYYERFLKRFPTPESLAEAAEEDVVAVWQGLGYYSRARNLQAGVREWVEKYGSKLPTDRKTLETLKGIGPYTSGALLSLVYGLPESAVDGNVFRVITRFTALAEPIDKPRTRQLVSEILLEMMPKKEAGDFNQSVMELGATLCSPRSPSCDRCPLGKDCLSFSQGTMLDFPKKKAPKPPKPVQVFAGVLIAEGKVLLRRRPSKGLLAGMWEFPAIEAASEEAGLQLLAELFLENRISIEVGELICGVDHIFSHRRWDLKAYHLKAAKLPKKLAENWQWRPWGAKEEVLWAGPHRKIADYLLNQVGE